MKPEIRNTIIIWIAIISVLIATGLTFYFDTRAMALHNPKLNENIEITLAEIESLDKSYAQAIEKKASFRDKWSIVALIAAAISAGAVVLRAPQPALIALGVFLAIVYGALKLHPPETVIGTLSKARSKLACLQPQVHQLATAQQSYLGEIDSLIQNLNTFPEALSHFNLETEIYLERLNAVLKLKAAARADAVDAINNAAMIPIEANVQPLQILEAHLNELGALRNSLANITDQPTAPLFEILDRIEIQLNNAIQSLEKPAQLRSLMTAAANTYIQQLVHAQKAKTEAELLLKKAAEYLPKIEPVVASLNRWPGQLKRSNFAANKAVGDIHAALLADIAQSGPTVAQLAAIMEDMGRLVEPSTDAAMADTDTHTADLVGAADSVPTFVTDVQTAVANFETKAMANLRKWAANITQADQATQSLEKVVKTHVVLLTQSTDLIRETTQEMISRTKPFSAELAGTLASLDRSEMIIDQIDFESLNTEIQSCATKLG